MPSGRSLLVRFAPGDTPQTVSAVSGLPAVTVNGTGVTPSGVIWYDPAGANPEPFVQVLLPTAVGSGDTVSLSSSSGWVSTVGIGAWPAITGLVATNHVGGSYLPDPLAGGSRTLKVGWQPNMGYYFKPTTVWANLFKNSSIDWKDPSTNLQVTNLDSDGFPITPPNPTVKFISIPQTDTYLIGGYPSCLYGVLTLLWNGTADMSLNALSNCTVTEVTTGIYPQLGVTTNKARQYIVAPTSGATWPGLYVTLDQGAGGTKTISGVRLFDGTVADPFNPPYFHPGFEAQISGAKDQIVRTKDLVNMDDGCSTVNVSDLPVASWAGNTRSFTSDQIQVSGMTSVNSGPYARTGVYQLKLTFSTTCPFGAGIPIQVNFPSGSTTTASYLFTFADSTTLSCSVAGVYYPITSTSGIILGVIPNKAIVPVDLTSTPSYTSVGRAGCCGDDPFLIQANLTSDIVYSLYYTASDALATYMGGRAAALVSSGRTIYSELGNEPWNYILPCWTHIYTMGLEYAQTRQTAGDGSWVAAGAVAGFWWYCMRAAQTFALFKAAWVAGGGDPTKCKLVLNTQFGYGAITTQFLDFCAGYDSLGRPSTDPNFGVVDGTLGYGGAIYPDILIVSAYLSIGFAPSPINPAISGALCDSVRGEQANDLADAFVYDYAFSNMQLCLSITNAAIAASAFPTIARGIYECGPQSFYLGGTQSVENQRTTCWGQSPRVARQFLTFCRWAQDAGFLFACKLAMGESVVGNEGAAIRTYAAYLALGQRPGPGDGSNGRTDNRTLIYDGSGMPRPFDPTLIDSPVGQAVVDWNGSILVPGGLSVTSVLSNSVVLALSDVIASSSYGAISNQFQRSLHGAGTWATLGTVTGASPAFTDTTSLPATAYDYRVLVAGQATNTVTVTTVAVLTPGVLSGFAWDTTHAVLGQTDDTNGTPPYSNQLVRSAHSAGSWANQGSPVAGPTIGAILQSGLTPGAVWDYKVKTSDVVGEVDSNLITITMPSAAPSDLATLFGARLKLWSKSSWQTWQDTGLTVPAYLSGDPVGGWTDLSGSANGPRQATGGNRAAITLQVVNGLPGVLFNGSTSVLSLATPIVLSPPFAIFVIGTRSSTGSDLVVAGHSSTAGLFTIHSNGVAFLHSDSGSLIGATVSFGVGPWIAYWRVNSDGSGSVGGTGNADVEIPGVSGNFTLNQVGAGQLFGSPLLSAGSIVEVAVISGTVTSGELTSALAYLTGQCGLSVP